MLSYLFLEMVMGSFLFLHFICQVNLKLSTLFKLFELSCFVIGTLWYITCKQLIDLYV